VGFVWVHASNEKLLTTRRKTVKKKTLAFASLVTAAMLALSACGGETRGGDNNDADGSTGFPADSVIGVSLPWLGTQNWKESETYLDQQLKDAGFTPMIQAADNKAPQQQQQIEAMIQNGAKVLVVGAVDGTQLSSVLEKAKAEGIAIFGIDRLIENTEAVDGVIQFGSVFTGELQGQALLEGLEKLKGDGPYNIELFGGGPADPNAPDFFNGAMSVLQPKIDDGTLNIVSGQTDFTQAATQDWDNAKAQARMDSILSGFYSDKDIHGVLSPNDGIARAIITSAKAAGQDIPVVTGLDAENESLVSIWNDEQYATIAKSSEDLAARTVELISLLQKG
jgi:putative multiple sugar transport system substrate-binding protein